MLGDSVAWTLVFGLTGRQAEHHVYVANDVALGCGITRIVPGTRLMFRGQALRPRFCSDAPAAWLHTVDEVQPDVVTLLVGHQDVADRMLEGRWRHLGDPVFDAYVRAELDRVLTTVTERGVDVVLLTSPYFRGEERPNGDLWSEDDPARVDRFNRILRDAVARHPGRVTLFDLNRIVSPGGRYARTVDGVEVRAADGIHFHPEGADWLAGPLLRRLEAQGRPHRDARLSAPPTPTP
jgi:lysophospholipase L1-like esterase